MRATLLLFVVCAVAAAMDWSRLDRLLAEGVANGTFPGAVGVVGDSDSVLYLHAVGRFTYGQYPPHDPSSVPPVTVDTRWDMASCSKVMATTTAAAALYQRGFFHLEQPVAAFLGSAFNANGKQAVLIRHLLLHEAGFPPDPSPGYWEPAFGCPQSQFQHPAQDLSCADRIFRGVLNQTLDNPPGKVYVYSDISFVTMGYVVGQIVYRNRLAVPTRPQCANVSVLTAPGLTYTCYFEAFVANLLQNRLGMKHTGYLPDKSLWSQLPPTRNDTWYRHAVSQGVVDDENAYAMGGIAGHAGLFSTAQDIRKLLDVWLFGRDDAVLNATTRLLWTTEYDHAISCRALGWSTNDLTSPDGGWDGTCGKLSNRTFLHLGYTGTQICADPERKVYTLLLTNRVFPTGDNIKIQAFRKYWNDAIVEILDSN